MIIHISKHIYIKVPRTCITYMYIYIICDHRIYVCVYIVRHIMCMHSAAEGDSNGVCPQKI